MLHLYLHLQNVSGRAEDRLEDQKGAYYASLEDARHDAVRTARAIMSERVLLGKRATESTFEIVDESGSTVMKVPFEDAFDS